MSDPREEPPGRPATSRGRVLLALTAGIVSFLLATAWSQETARRETAAGRRERLADLVAARQSRTAELERQLEDVRRRLHIASRNAGRGRLPLLEQDLNRLAGSAGMRALRGSGITVELADSPLGNRGDPEAADFQIQDIDVQLVVNALWASGAEAIAINGQRIVGTTAIRSAGGAVLVNYRVLTSPFRISAIGNPERLEREFARSAIARRFRGWVDVYHLGFAIKRQRRLSVPAYAGAVRFRYAQPVKTNE